MALAVTTTTPVPPATIGEYYEHQLTATGGDGTYEWKIKGLLPDGLTLSATGLISGRPTGGIRMAEFSFTALKDEIVNDTEGLGYKNSATPNDWKGDQEIADLINAKNLVIDRPQVASDDINGDTQFDWYDGMSIDRQEFYTLQTRREFWKVSVNMKLFLTGRTLTVNGVAGTGTDSQSEWAAADDQDAAPAMLALIELAGSRSEVLWGQGTNITLGQVGAAFNEI